MVVIAKAPAETIPAVLNPHQKKKRKQYQGQLQLGS